MGRVRHSANAEAQFFCRNGMFRAYNEFPYEHRYLSRSKL